MAKEWRSACGVAEAGIGSFDDVLKLEIRKNLPHEGAHHPVGDGFIGLALEQRDLTVTHLRNRFGHVEPAVLSQPGEQNGFKIEYRQLQLLTDHLFPSRQFQFRQQAAQRAAGTAKRNGVREVEIRVKGPGAGRERQPWFT